MKQMKQIEIGAKVQIWKDWRWQQGTVVGMTGGLISIKLEGKQAGSIAVEAVRLAAIG